MPILKHIHLLTYVLYTTLIFIVSPANVVCSELLERNVAVVVIVIVYWVVDVLRIKYSVPFGGFAGNTKLQDCVPVKNKFLGSVSESVYV